MKPVLYKSSGERPPFHQEQISVEQVQKQPAEGGQVNKKILRSAYTFYEMDYHTQKSSTLKDRIKRLRGRGKWPQQKPTTKQQSFHQSALCKRPRD